MVHSGRQIKQTRQQEQEHEHASPQLHRARATTTQGPGIGRLGRLEQKPQPRAEPASSCRSDSGCARRNGSGVNSKDRRYRCRPEPGSYGRMAWTWYQGAVITNVDRMLYSQVAVHRMLQALRPSLAAIASSRH